MGPENCHFDLIDVTYRGSGNIKCTVGKILRWISFGIFAPLEFPKFPLVNLSNLDTYLGLIENYCQNCFNFRAKNLQIFLMRHFLSFFKHSVNIFFSIGHWYLRCLSILLRRPLLPIGFNSCFRFTSGVLHCFDWTETNFLLQTLDLDQSFWIYPLNSIMGNRHPFLQVKIPKKLRK